jgi:hypothetical protein
LQLVKTIEADYKGVKNPTGPFGWDNPFLCWGSEEKSGFF